MRKWLALAASILFAASGSAANAQGAAIPDLPRNETLIVENPEGTIKTPGMVQPVGRQPAGPVDGPAPARARHASGTSTRITA